MRRTYEVGADRLEAGQVWDSWVGGQTVKEFLAGENPAQAVDSYRASLARNNQQWLNEALTDGQTIDDLLDQIETALLAYIAECQVA